MGKHQPPPPNASQVPTTDGTNVQADIDAIRGQLSPLSSLRVNDPNLASLEVDNTPSPGAPTRDPHRLTFVVPTPDDTVLSLGREGPAARIADLGISGRTKTHVHFTTTAGPAKTIVSLGNGAATGTVTAQDANVPKKDQFAGYGMVTDMHSWQDAAKQFVMISRTDDVVVRTASDRIAALQSDEGAVEVAAGTAATVAAAHNVVIAADASMHTVNTPYGEKRHELHVSKMMGAKVSKGLMTLGDILISADALTASFKKTSFEPKEGKSAWSVIANPDVIKLKVDAAKLVSTVLRAADDWQKYTGLGSGSSKVGIQSSGYASMTASIASSMYGHLSASMTSLLSASMLGGSASVKGFLWTSIWAGLETSLKARKNVKIEGENGTATMKGKKAVEISSKEGHAMVTGQKEVQLNATGGPAYVHGTASVYAGAGKGAGYGFKAKPDELKMGKLSSADKFASPGFETLSLLEFNANHIEVVHDRSGITLDGSLIRIESPEIKIFAKSGGDVKINGGKILLG